MHLRVKELRKARGLTQVELSTLCDVPRSTISLVENGSANTTLQTLQSIADGLGVEVADLFASRSKRSIGAIIQQFNALPDDERKEIVAYVDAKLGGVVR